MSQELQMPTGGKDQIIPLDAADRSINDLFAAISYGTETNIFIADVSEAIRFLETYRERTGVKVTFTTFLIRACGLVIKQDPRIHYMLRGYRWVNPSSVDIGISVAGRTRMAPVVTIREAESKSLETIAEELARESRLARTQEDQSIKALAWLARIIPFGFVRRWILRLVMGSQRMVRGGVGTFQITNIGSLGLEAAVATTVTSTLLIVGAIVDRVIPVDGEPAVRPTVQFATQADHRIMDGQIHASFMHKLKAILADPWSAMEIPSGGALPPARE